MLFLLLSSGFVTACGPRTTGAANVSASQAPRAATADDYVWFEQEQDLARGFCFTWIHNVRTPEVLKRLGSTELERVNWQQLVGSGDGQRGQAARDFAGIARIDDWILIVEDNGRLGATDSIAQALSVGTTLISHFQSSDGHGRYLVLEDTVPQLDFDPLLPGTKTGARAQDPDVLTAMTAAGFDLTGSGPLPRSADPVHDRNHAMEAAFALTERQTSIPMTKLLLTSKSYGLTAVSHPR
jgi:hypothetical protein